jgi:hypothetical protein
VVLIFMLGLGRVAETIKGLLDPMTMGLAGSHQVWTIIEDGSRRPLSRQRCARLHDAPEHNAIIEVVLVPLAPVLMMTACAV